MAADQAIIKGQFNKLIFGLYLVLCCIGLLAIFSVEHKPNDNILQNILGIKTNYAKQLMYLGISLIVGFLIILTDTKLFSTLAWPVYVLGLLLMFVTIFIGKEVNGSKSWIPLGFMNLQPAETCKIFVSLALAKYLSNQDTDFTKFKSHLTAIAIALAPAVLSILQSETGLALVYFSFFVVLYREGLPAVYLIVGIALTVLIVAAILIEPNTLFLILTAAALLALYIFRKKIKRQRGILVLIVSCWAFAVGIQKFAVPFIFEDVFQPYQTERIMSMFGKEYIPQDSAKLVAFEKQKAKMGKTDATESYNVKQSKIAIGSGGLAGKGFLKGAVTQGEFVPAQHTDFIFTVIGESFGFWGTTVVVIIYGLLLLVIINVAERQRSAFSRIYMYGVASIFFFHTMINICMTIGFAPVIGIPLPLVSYGGSSLLTFTVLIFILLRMDMDRQMVLR